MFVIVQPRVAVIRRESRKLRRKPVGPVDTAAYLQYAITVIVAYFGVFLRIGKVNFHPCFWLDDFGLDINWLAKAVKGLSLWLRSRTTYDRQPSFC